jgi:PAN domain
MKTLNVVRTLDVLFLAFLLVPALFVQNAAAWETGMDRPGMDYRSFWINKNIEAFVAVKQCEDACKNDSQCKAFTYVYAGVQGTNARCYLKKGVPSQVKNKFCTSGVVRPETKADYCTNYAITAVQFSNNNKTGECNYTGNRWSDDYTFHYKWCMEKEKSESKHESDERKKLMNQCLKPSKSGDLSAHNWCYDVSYPQAFQPMTISFHPVIKNVGDRDWKSEIEGQYSVGVIGAENKSQNFTLPSFYRIKPGEGKILKGVTLPFHKNNVYSLVSWHFSHNDDVNTDNNEFVYNIVFYGEDLMHDARLADMKCQNLENIISNTKTFTAKGCDPCNSKLGDVESDELNGIAHSDDYWFWSSNGAARPSPEVGGLPLKHQLELARAPRNSLTSVQKYGSLPNFLKQKGYDHFGDLDFYENLLYVPVTGGDCPILAVYNINLGFVKYGKFPKERQADAAWVSINPKDKDAHLYTHGESFNKLNVYSRHFSNDSDGDTLKYIKTITLKFKHAPKYTGGSWWNGVWNQGGAFSKDGIFYLVLDHASIDDDENTGVHAFKLEGSTGTELTLRNGKKNFIHISYDTETLGHREEELEGITVVNHGNLDEINVILLNNEVTGDDQVYLYHYFVNNGS